MADEDARVLDATPYTGNSLPGKCILTPEMKMLDCEAGRADDDWAFAKIEEDAGG